MAKTSLTHQRYMPQLDALRFFAVLGVMVAHFWHPRKLPGLIGDLDWAGLGVRLFFVLSGFLITGILLECQEMKEKTRHPSRYYIRQFYARRFLRIFPIYYLVLFIAFIFNIPPARDVWIWLTTYTTNIYITIFQDWVGRFGHFWTLAVEEQFYLFWPWLVLFAPKKWLVPALLVIILLAPPYRLFAYINFPFDIGAMDFKAGTFTLANLDSLGIGALLAVAWRSKITKETLQKYLSRVVLPAGLVIFTLTLVLYHYRLKPSVFFVLGNLGSGLIFAWLVSSAGFGFNGLVGKFLEFPLFIFLGKISYGIYVYHNFMPMILIPVFGYFGIPLQVPGRLNFILSSVLTIVIASISWHLLELPINRLKRYFQYTAKPIPAISQIQLTEGER